MRFVSFKYILRKHYIKLASNAEQIFHKFIVNYKLHVILLEYILNVHIEYILNIYGQ